MKQIGGLFFLALLGCTHDLDNCQYCGEWVLLSADGEEIFFEEFTLSLNPDGTYMSRDALFTDHGDWTLHEAENSITFASKDGIHTYSWEHIKVSGDTLRARTDRELILVRYTDDLKGLMKEGSLVHDRFICFNTSEKILHTYQDRFGKKYDVEIENRCADDKFISGPDPEQQQSLTEKYRLHYSNTLGLVRFYSGESFTEREVHHTQFDRTDWPDTNALLYRILFDDYYASTGKCSFQAEFIDTSGKVVFSRFFDLDAHGNFKDLGALPHAPDHVQSDLTRQPLPVDEGDE